MNIESRLGALSIKLPPCPEPAASYVPGVLSGNLIFVSGQTPKKGKELVFKGKVGRELSIEEGKKAAEICILRGLSAAKSIIGSLDKIERIIKVTGYVNTYDNFTDHSVVIDGASELLEKILGEKGRHSRVAIGTNSLPGDAPVEIEMIIQFNNNI